MTEKPNEPEITPTNGDEEEKPAPIPERLGPTVPNPVDRSPEVERKIRSAVERMFEAVQNPYETVIVAAQEARRINEQRLKARSILNQGVEAVEELVPEVPFVPRPIEDEEPEVKPTNEAIEKMACGLVTYEIDGKQVEAPSYYDGEIDFELYPEKQGEDASEEP
jgi:DNA-directed RNA polymerase subunit K/omega